MSDSRMTAVVLAKDEERHLAPCIESLGWVDELVVLIDSRWNVRDRMVEIARRYTVTVCQREFDTFPRQRNAALQLVHTDWVLFVDVDERATPELGSEVRQVLAEQARVPEADAPAGYWVPRQNIILGNRMRHTGWYPDYQLRLLCRDKAHYDEAIEVHEVATLAGNTDYLKNPLVHYNYERLNQFLTKQNRYAAELAQTMFARGQRVKPQNYILQPYREFKRRYFEWSGYKDGAHGFFLSTLMAWFDFVSYVKLRRLEKGQR